MKEKKKESRIIITLDEFFKMSSKRFFESDGFRVETELEIFKLPKRLDVLVVKNPKNTLPEDFTLFGYWKENNLISFKSKPDSLKVSDILDTHVYLNGYINMTKGADYENTTMNLLVNHHPHSFIKKYSQFCNELEPGLWELNLNFYKVYLIDIRKIGLDGLDRLFLSNFSTDDVFGKILQMLEDSPKMGKFKKWIDRVRDVVYDRLRAFEKDPEVRSKYMATAFHADITDIVRPYMEESEKRGIERGIEKKALEDARLMKAKGYPVEDILEITGLSNSQLKENGII